MCLSELPRGVATETSPLFTVVICRASIPVQGRISFINFRFVVKKNSTRLWLADMLALDVNVSMFPQAHVTHLNWLNLIDRWVFKIIKKKECIVRLWPIVTKVMCLDTWCIPREGSTRWFMNLNNVFKVRTLIFLKVLNLTTPITQKIQTTRYFRIFWAFYFWAQFYNFVQSGRSDKYNNIFD